MGSGIKLRRTDQIPDILQEHDVASILAQCRQALRRHSGVHVTHTVRMKLERLCAEGFDPLRIHIRINIRFQDGNGNLRKIPDRP